MDSAIQRSSLDAYHQMPTSREEVRAAIANNNREGGITDREIAEITGLEINCVTGRRNELVGAGEVSMAGSRLCSVTGRMATTWSVEKVASVEALKKKLHRSRSLTFGELKEIAQCLDRSIDSRATRLAERCRLLGGV